MRAKKNWNDSVNFIGSIDNLVMSNILDILPLATGLRLNLQSIVNTIKKKSANTKICISPLFVRKDKKGIEIKVSELNRQLKTFCEENLIHFLLNENIDESCLGRGKLHLNRKGSKLFALNLISFMKPFY